MLEPLGVTRSAEDVYCALLKHGPLTETRLADLVSTDADKVGDGLAELRGLGLVVEAPGSPDRWQAEPPETLAALVVRQQEELVEQQRLLDRTQAAVADLVRLSRTRGHGHGGAVVEVTSDVAEIGRRCGHLSRTAEDCVMALGKLPGIDADGDSDELAMIRRGVEYQAVYERDLTLRPDRFEAVRRLAAAGEQARTLPSVPMRFVVYDRSTAVVRLDDGEGLPETALFVHRSTLLAGLVALFDLLWERAVPVPPAPEDDAAATAPAEFDDVLLTLLAAGFKDESIARYLGISPSTVTRRMARLMDVAGTSTRFQLGMQAVRRGWI